MKWIFDKYMTDKDVDYASQTAEMYKRYDNMRESQQKQRLDKRVEGTKPSLEPDGYIGEYEDKMYGKAEVVEEGGELRGIGEHVSPPTEFRRRRH